MVEATHEVLDGDVNFLDRFAAVVAIARDVGLVVDDRLASCAFVHQVLLAARVRDFIFPRHRCGEGVAVHCVE